MKTPQSFFYPDIKGSDYVFGSGEVLGNILAFDGDWRPFLPPSEHQRRNNIESSSCFIEAQQHTIATILERQYSLVDENYSSRFNLIFSEATPSGGDPLKGAQTFRDYGLIPDTLLPFSDLITNWHQFNSFFLGDRDQCIKAGIEWRAKWVPKYDIVINREMDVETKYKRLKDALKYSPICVSVAEDYETGKPKPKGVFDIHMVELVYIDEKNRPYIWDTYEPFLKRLAPNYDFEFGMRWTVEPNTIKERITLIQKIINLLYLLLPIRQAEEKALKVPLYWNTPALARNSVRQLCDEEGLNQEQKDTLCATIGAESGWKPLAIGKPNTDGSRDYGIVQINDKYWIGPSKKFPSTDYVLNNPEVCVRWMCQLWKQRKRNYWSAWNNGSYKKFL
jgi:hypothetical protein